MTGPLYSFFALNIRTSNCVEALYHDTNVFISACLGKGPSNAVVKSCLLGENTALMGTALLTEYEGVLGRVELFKRSRLDESEREELFDIFLATCNWTRIYFGWRPNLTDESDNHLVELAVAGGASHIVIQKICGTCGEAN